MPHTPIPAWKGDLSADYNGYEVIFVRSMIASDAPFPLSVMTEEVR